MDNVCVLCGKIIPEGRLVCISCENSSHGVKGRKQSMAQNSRGYVEVIGPCSKYITGKGWTTQVPEEQLASLGYNKVGDDFVVIPKSTYINLMNTIGELTENLIKRKKKDGQ